MNEERLAIIPRRSAFAIGIAVAFGGCPLAGFAQATDAPVQLAPVQVVGETIDDGYHVSNTSTATRTDTPLVDVPQSITVVTRRQVLDQSAQNIADVVRYVPGVVMAQGEGNRETPVFRGNASTSDFFVNGMRDDVQYYRDLYNIERIEVLKGPNAMIFGRGGVGGVINRVTRQANWDEVREMSLQVGSFANRRATVDLGTGFNENISGRITALLEDSGSYRDGVSLQRDGINPTLSLRTGKNTLVTLGYEYFRDERVADRGIASQNGKPFPTDESTFFGNPKLSPTDTELNTTTVGIEHRFTPNLTLRNRTLYGSYDKFYQNVFASGAVSATGTVPIQAYFAATDRQNLFNQTDLIYKLSTGIFQHTLLAGAEFGRQRTANLRLTGQFADGPDADANPDTTFIASASDPNISEPLVGWVVGANDGNNSSVTKIAAVYAQDQIRITEQFEAVVGVRFDQFNVDFTNRRTDVAPENREINTKDSLVSPRVGLIYKPLEVASLYASYSLSYLPRSGEQLASLSPTNKAFDPEEYKNYEVGAKWDLRPDLSVTIAVYQLDRSNVILPPINAGDASTLGDGARTQGIELGVSGNITKAWSMAGGYAYQDSKLTATTGATARDGSRTANVPYNTFSLWNRYDFTPSWGAGVGVFTRSSMYTTTSNAVKLEGYTRVDGAIFYTLTPKIRAQLNVENLLGEDYFVNAHTDNNILPGAPANVRVSLIAGF
ncbi:TonB-dependent receptor [Nevskia ramosa]|uniref:TonB-dependent receptor n=1 Tax=Nevskia ramosa TaxID=64002 RepID=UPI0003B3C7D2|nr:TonB-dependent siderophore receptor [Nevskia ramosa]